MSEDGLRERRGMASASFSAHNDHGTQIGQNYGPINIESHSQHEHEKLRNETCLRDLQITNSRFDKKRIEKKKGGLLKDVYKWVLENRDFQIWRDGEKSQLLWVHGDPGKGKTMLLCGIIDELTGSSPNAIAYFFCQANDSRFNHDTSALRGLISMLIDQNPSLISHVRNVYDTTGKHAFEGINASEYLSEILTSILSDSRLETTYLMIDALDECKTGLAKLLDLIAQQSSNNPNIKWIVFSRNWPEITDGLEDATSQTRLSLELNDSSIAEAVDFYIQYKVDKLSAEKRYNTGMRGNILQHLRSSAHGTFLWVALVCERLEALPRNITPRNLDVFAPGLHELYQRMLDHIEDAPDDIPDLCRSILGVIATVFRPIMLDELPSCIDMSGRLLDQNAPEILLELCGSFVTVRERTIYLVHQSVLDFLLGDASQVIFLSGINNTHRSICSNSLMAISKGLRKDICDVRHPGVSIEDLEMESIDDTPLAVMKYACIFWMRHLHSFFQHSGDHIDCYLQENGPVHRFFKSDFLHWLEALSLLQGLSDALQSIMWLDGTLTEMTDGSHLIERLHDAYRFLKFHMSIIERHPLQIYISALLFSPRKSIMRKTFFESHLPEWVLKVVLNLDPAGPFGPQSQKVRTLLKRRGSERTPGEMMKRSKLEPSGMLLI